MKTDTTSTTSFVLTSYLISVGCLLFNYSTIDKLTVGVEVLHLHHIQAVAEKIPLKMKEVPAYQVGYRDMVTEKVGVIITDRVVMNHQQIVKKRPVQSEMAVTVGDLDAITKKIWTDNTYLLVTDLVD